MRAKVRKLKVCTAQLRSRMLKIEWFLQKVLYKLIFVEDLERIEPSKRFVVEYLAMEKGHMVSIGAAVIQKDAFYSYTLIPITVKPPLITHEVWGKLVAIRLKRYDTRDCEKHALEYFFSLQSRTSVFAKDLHRRIWRGSEVKIL